MNPVLLIKTGSRIPEIRERPGDFEDWFAEVMDYPEMFVVDVQQGGSLPAHLDYSAIVITGSGAMVSHREIWSEKTASWLKNAVEERALILGVCYGHQLLAHALGGDVGPNPNGRQIGSQRIELEPAAAADPLFQNMPASFQVNTSHEENVLTLPEGAVRLARSPGDENHAFRYGDFAWGVQFHPEFDATVMLGYLDARAEAIRSEGQDPQALKRQVVETPLAMALMKVFLKNAQNLTV
jgi:GMP synthase (glutamine-hydrolysing)